MGTITEDNNDNRDEITIVIVSDSHPHGDQKLVVYSDIIGIRDCEFWYTHICKELHLYHLYLK